jgi:hypothetical protein
MAFADEFSPQSGKCDICGAMLGDEVVVQEFADGSMARLCSECAAGADLGGTPPAEQPSRSTVWPDLPTEPAHAPAAETDPLEKTRELLLPVTDLIALQGEMQAALERLAASLERFALEMITESQGRSQVQSRVQELEQELQKTRTQLTETEFLLNVAAKPGQPAVETPSTPPQPAVETPAEPAVELPEVALPVPLVAPPLEPAAPEVAARERRKGNERRKIKALPATDDDERRHAAERRQEDVGVPPDVVLPQKRPAAKAAPAQTTGQISGHVFVPAQAVASASGDIQSDQVPNFRIDEVQAAQRFYNECSFVSRIRDVRRSLGKPKANVTRVPGPEPLAYVTICWDIVWYQYLVDLRRDLPLSAERVTLYREGMDLDELDFHFREKNAVINDDGRLDASELEVRLLSDPNALIPEMAEQDETQLMDDLTEETWGSRVAPEFKWDD